ncbi:MAG TPA: hypothetical protein VMP01_17335 [Pirellulaceae bacterium]|nr:hypothetical protein [Pirellulaceae bacterium]
MLLRPLRKTNRAAPEVPNEFELNSIRHDPERLAKIRTRLSDISWWMRLLCQNIAQRANRDDGEFGKFFQSRFRAVRIFPLSIPLRHRVGTSRILHTRLVSAILLRRS